ncbi:hypothetical protein [Salinarimonas chemoclinalis]|uniref:hypothetical protein n=1 Tax=Salinarimonas chemoclinalis TaxID=3241599 RepID=UPI003558C5D4
MPRAAAIPEDDYVPPALEQFAAALVLLGWDVKRVAAEAGIPVARARRALAGDESGKSVGDRRVIARSLRGVHVEFIPAAGRFGPGVRTVARR